MKNVLIHDGASQQMLSNVDDGTNTLFINGIEIPSSDWVGSGYYTQTIGSTTISIARITSLTGNIMMQKVSDNNYQMISKGSSGSGNYLIWA